MIIDAKKLILIYIIALIVVLWISGIIPKQIGKVFAINYVNKNYPSKNLDFLNIDYSPIHNSYFVSFKDVEGRVYNFELCSRYFPITIWFDPFNYIEG
ncbi:hypothetical protein [Clostridium sp. Cult3]|uniref:hypothetical protein n=1 Tax=Clostridium sp. Cult3 TaxID=2079004 RepID=UPI001F1D1117|nr:hypothetical protein [Clostridium sp. Cult3]MCF6460347.1 hypothetical protein [Clostridium sp. Cult3]